MKWGILSSEFHAGRNLVGESKLTPQTKSGCTKLDLTRKKLFFFVRIGLLTTLGIMILAVSSATPSLAQGGGNRPTPKAPPQMPSPPQVNAPLRGAALAARAQSAGTIKVIVYLNTRFVPEGNLINPTVETVATSSAVRSQRANIAQAKASLLRQMAPFNMDVTANWEGVPGFAVTTNAAGVQALQNSPLVRDVYEDIPEPAVMGYELPYLNLSSVGGAWAQGVDGTGMTVAILDTGALATHEFLNGKVVWEACFSTNGTNASSLCPGGAASVTGSGAANPFTRCVALTGDPEECTHGTHVAGTVAGNWGYYSASSLIQPINMGGVARGASLIPIQVFTYVTDPAVCGASPHCVVSYTADQVSAIDYVYNTLASVGPGAGAYNIASINMSLGGGSYSGSNCDTSDPVRQAALANLRSVGIAPAIASGNDGYVNSMGRPGCLSAAVAVGATETNFLSGPTSGYITPNWPTNAWCQAYAGITCYGTGVEKVGYFSNGSPALELLAPGFYVESSILGANSGITNDYALFPGTSMATPHVAGAWAVLKQQSPVATVDRILATLQNTGVSITDSSYTGNSSAWPPSLATFRSGAPGTVFKRIDVGAAVLALGRDFGDAPNTYGTLNANNGARHIRVPEYYLGAGADSEADGTPGVDDGDDGVTFPTMNIGTTVNLNVTASVAQTAGFAPNNNYLGRLNAWIDFNRDGDFADAGEKVASDVVMTGPYPQAISVTIPAGASAGATWARFRYSTQTGLSYTGQAYNGEVEDYQVTLAAPAAPEIVVESPGSANITDAGTYNMGTTTVGTPIVQTITVRNTGTATLNLLTNPPTYSAGFTASSFGSTSVAAGGSTTFTLTCTATAQGAPVSGTLSFANSDGDENPFNFTVNCTVIANTSITVSAGYDYTCKIKLDRTLACWGTNSGYGNPPGGTFVQISAGGGGDGDHACGVREDGTVSCWGSNSYGAATPPGGTFTQVSAGGGFTCGVKTDGTLACWGQNTDGKATPPSGTFTQVSAGREHACGIRTDGTLACWGMNWDGLISPPPSGTFTQVTSGETHSCAIRTDQTVVCWGYGGWGQAESPSDTFLEVTAGLLHTCGLKTDGRPTCWGYGQWNPIPPGTFTEISAGRAHTCAVRTDGKIACWWVNGLNLVSFTPASLTPGAFRIPYSQTFTPSGGTAPYTFIVVDGVLPPGLNLSGIGVLSGTPTSGGSYTFTLEVEDLNNVVGQQSYTMTVDPRTASDLSATTVSQTRIDLTWRDNSDDETGFKVERSPQGENNWTLLDTTAANVTSYSDTTAACGTTYDYRVRATNALGDFDPSNIATATTVLCTPAVPTLVSPTNGSSSIDNTPDFDWGDVLGATQYQIQIDNDADFLTPVISTTTAASTYTPAAALTDGVYYWHVRAGNGTWSNYSTAWTVTVMIPILTSPINGSTTADHTPTFDWNDVVGATQYQIEVDDNSDFSSPAISTTTTASTYTPTTDLPDDVYYWHVQVSNGVVWSAYSTSWTVIVKTPLVVTTLNDELNTNGLCSLREAINNANNNNQSGSVDCAAGYGADSITFGVSGTIVLSSQLPGITSEMVISGAGQTAAISGNGAVRVFYVGSGGNLTLDTLTVQNGNEGAGGAIYNDFNGRVTVINSTLANNSAANNGGGAIFSTCGGMVRIANSTISGNSATGNFGGGAIKNICDGIVVVTNSTFSGNSTTSLYQENGDIANSGGTVYMTGTILDTGTSGGNCYGAITDNGYNLSDDGSCGLSGPGSQNYAALNLGALADNGGPAQTHLPGTDSAAIDVIPYGTTIDNNGMNYTCGQTGESLDFDQRGQPRPAAVGGNCDAGAVEDRDQEWLCPDPANITTADELNNCILWADVTAGPQTLDLGADITLSALLFPITSDITLNSNGHFVSGNNVVRVFYVASTGHLTIDAITIQNGSAANGGGVFNAGTLTLTNSTLSNNSASAGGGLYNSGNATVTNSTFSTNSAGDGQGGGLFNTGTVTLTHSTFSNNWGGDGQGGAITNTGTVYLAATILDRADWAMNCYGSVTDNGYNLSNDGSCYFGAPGSQNESVLPLGPLAHNGGPTQTHQPGVGSPAIDLIPAGTTINNHGVSYTCDQTGEPLDTDQRGQPRPATAGGRCDAGAVEETDHQNWSCPNPANITTKDELASCIWWANLTAGAQTLGLGANITLSAPLPAVTSDMTLNGNGHFVSGSNAVRVFYVSNSGNLTLNLITVQNGHAESAGGGIYNDYGILTVLNSTLSGNWAAAEYYYYASGGGIFSSGTLTVTNSTLSGNSATNSGGGIYTSGTATVTNSTFSGSSAYYGGSIENYGTAYLAATILDKGGQGSNCYGDSITDNGYNLSNDGSCSFSATGSQNSITLMLGQLGDHGGPNQTYMPGGLVIDLIPAGTTINNHGVSYTCNQTGEPLDTDQRGQPRPATAGGRCDAGAVEVRDRSWSCSNPSSITTEDALNSCIWWANNTAGSQTLGLSADITLSSPLFSISSEIILNGNGHFVSGSDAMRVLYVESTGSLTLNAITVKNGKSDNGGGVYNAGTLTITNSTLSNSKGYIGGGIYNGGTLTITNSTLSGNAAAGELSKGGGIYNSGTLTITNSTLSGNSSDYTGYYTSYGGGIYVYSGTLTITNSTLSGNSAYYAGGIFVHGVTTITNSTLSGNSAYYGGGITNWYGANQLHLSATILDTGSRGANCYSSSFINNGYNLSDDGSCGFSGTSQNNAVLNLGVLSNNGGATRTHPLGIGSAAINFIPSGTIISNNGTSYTCDQNGETLDSDQRGQPRPETVGAACDAGSFEAPAGAGCYTLTTSASPVDGGTTAASPSANCAGGYTYGTMVTLTATSAPGYSFSEWSGDVSGAANPLMVTMAGNLNVTGRFVPPIVVNSLSDTVIGSDGWCTLREAITAANTNTPSGGVPGECPAGGLGADKITFSLSGTITLGSQLPSITTPITIDGAGRAIAISGNNTVRVFYVANSSLTLNALTVQNGQVASDSGGAIYSDHGTLVITNSTLSGNSAVNGGGIYGYSGTLTISNSTLSGNSASSGGGIYNSSSTLTITHSTLSGNSATYGGGIFNPSSTTYLSATILDTGSRGTNCYSGSFINNGYNLSDDGSCGFSGTSQNNAVLTLGALSNNGGATRTHPLGIGSAAINLIPSGTTISNNGTSYACGQNGEALDTDQRGQPRPEIVGAACDAGAFEAPAGAGCYTLTTSASPVDGGTIATSPSPNCAGGYTYGTVVTLTATSASGYSFSEWSGDVSSAANPATVVTVANLNVTGNFVSTHSWSTVWRTR